MGRHAACRSSPIVAVRVFDFATDQMIGVLTEEQFQFLQEHLEAEDADDHDYYLNRATLDGLAQQGGDPSVIGVLRSAMGSREEMDIRWQRYDEADADPGSESRA